MKIVPVSVGSFPHNSPRVNITTDAGLVVATVFGDAALADQLLQDHIEAEDLASPTPTYDAPVDESTLPPAEDGPPALTESTSESEEGN